MSASGLEGKLQALVLGSDGPSSLKAKCAKGGEVDGVDVGAGSRNNEVLVQGVEGDLTGRSGQEGQLAGDQAAQVAEEAVLLAFLADDRSDTTDETVITVDGEVSLDITQRSHDHIGEGGSQGDGALEVADGRDVLAGKDGTGIEVSEGTVGVEQVQLFLGLDGSDGIGHGLLEALILELVSLDLVGDVVQKFGEEGHLPELVVGNHSKRQKVILGRCRRRGRAVGKSTMGLVLNVVQLGGRVLNIGEAVGQREAERVAARASGRRGRGAVRCCLSRRTPAGRSRRSGIVAIGRAATHMSTTVAISNVVALLKRDSGNERGDGQRAENWSNIHYWYSERWLM